MNAVNPVKPTRKAPGLDYEGESPIPAQNPRPNAVTLAAVQRARDIMSGKIKVEWQHPPAIKEELKAQLRKMVDEEA